MTDEQNAKKVELENKQTDLTPVEYELLKALGNLRDALSSGVAIEEAREALKVAEKAFDEEEKIRVEAEKKAIAEEVKEAKAEAKEEASSVKK